MSVDLTEFGWDDRWAAAFAPYAADGLIPARVAIEFNYIYRIFTAGGEVNAQQAGRLRHRAGGRHELAAVGDWVAVKPSGTPGTFGPSGTIEAILPRRSKFSRKVAAELTEEQVVAANIDTVFLMMGLDQDFNLRRLERYLITAFESGATPVILLNKADLSDDLPARIADVSAIAPGTPVHAISAKPKRASGGFRPADRPHGIDVVHEHLGRGRTGALLGSSGVGKSTLINALIGSEMLKTREVREHDSRGRHTTRHRQLIVLPDSKGLLIDTPGMRELQLWVDETATESFEDIESLAAHCHFTNCRHRDEPRCAVKRAVEEGRLSAARLASYHKLQDEIRALDARKDVRARIDEKRQGKSTHKALKHLYKLRGHKE